ATFENHGGALIPGATYAVSTTNAGAAALSVPGLAVQWDRTGAFVWKIQPDGAAVRVGVTVLQRRDEAALVAGDMIGGDTVIVEGADRIRPGMSFPAPGVSASGVASVSAGVQ
ncbi:MAG: hypothetical protein KDA46_13145, partial [Parvularculaceae bacterium]|nr:hypothetical protein [Parvularculaceae bacterium]